LNDQWTLTTEFRERSGDRCHTLSPKQQFEGVMDAIALLGDVAEGKDKDGIGPLIPE